jgi:hypothetical protein
MIYAKFYLINTWRDVASLALNPPFWKVYQDSSWEGGAPAILDHIPADDGTVQHLHW